jgi:hypothetical protein
MASSSLVSSLRALVEKKRASAKAIESLRVMPSLLEIMWTDILTEWKRENYLIEKKSGNRKETVTFFPTCFEMNESPPSISFER